MLISASAFGAKKCAWQAGDIDPVEQVSVYHSVRGIGTVTIPLVIHTTNSVYEAQEEAVVPYSEADGDLSGGVAIEQSYLGNPGSLLPWIGQLSGPVMFAVRGKTLYYLDHRGKQHRARVIAISTKH